MGIRCSCAFSESAKYIQITGFLIGKNISQVYNRARPLNSPSSQHTTASELPLPPDHLSRFNFLSKVSTRFVLKVWPIPERQQEAVTDDHTQAPQDGQPQADVVEVVVAAS